MLVQISTIADEIKHKRIILKQAFLLNVLQNFWNW